MFFIGKTSQKLKVAAESSSQSCRGVSTLAGERFQVIDSSIIGVLFLDITEEDISLDYASEPDEYESEYVQDLLLVADQFEVYIGNTGKVKFENYYRLFRQYGFIRDMTFWRTHNHLYHCRVAYRCKAEADKVIEQMNNRKFYGKRLRVWHALDRIELDYAAAIRIDDLAQGEF